MKPLEDLRVIAVEQYGAGPYGSLHLAELGADVIKIEDPSSNGDVSRYIPPYQEGEDSLFYETFNRNKRSISLDLTSDSGREVFEKLVSSADAVYSNLRGDVPVRLGLTYNDLAHINKQIVCVSLTGFGMAGPRSARPGYDYLFQAMAGWMSVTGDPDGPPTKTGLSLVDFSGGQVAALTLLAGVHAARRDGKGMDCDLSLQDVALSLLTYDATWALNSDWIPQRRERSAHPSLVPFQAFLASDDRWFVVACAKEKFWQLLVQVLGDSRLNGQKFVDFAGRNLNRNELIEILDGLFEASPASHWIAELEAAGVPVAPVLSVQEALADLVATDSEMIVEVEHERFGNVRQLRTAVKVGDAGLVPKRAPKRNEHAPDILAELGYSDLEVESLTASGAFG